ncbi:hypothetical protein [Nocardioides dilutus]
MRNPTPTPRPSFSVRRVLAVAVPLAIAGSAVSTLPASAFNDNGDPAGNNGTVKITTQSPCTFDVEWYGFDEGADIVSSIEFTEQAPTSGVGLSVTGPTEVFVGEDPATGAGTDSGFDGAATYTYTAAFADPDNPQSYHVKATVHTPGSQGADTKYKVFWLEPCADAPPPNES